MKKFTSYLLGVAFGALMFIYSCSPNESNPQPPNVTGPGNIVQVQEGKLIDVTFSVATPGGYKASSVLSQSGNAVQISSEPSKGAPSGSVVVNYTANSSGADQINLTVSDNSDQSTQGAATVDVTKLPPPPPNVVLAGVISEDSTLTSDRIWELQGRVIVDDGTTLTIEPGTIIKGREGAGTNASVLIVSRGGKIMAVGTTGNPIVFTSILDNIKVGENFGSNLMKEDNEKWGGLIILGKAPISAGDGDTESSIEGLPSDEPYAKYGGEVPDDDSGVLKYVSIRHGGISISAGNEINGLTLGGVGSNTTIEDVEIFATLDDGIEFFGGTVTVKNAMITWQGDDGVDVDQNFAGTVDNFVVNHGVGVETDEGLEIDGPEGTTHTDGLFTIKNGTIINDGQDGTPGDFKAKAQGNVMNVVFQGYSSATIKIRASYTDACQPKTDAFTHLTQETPTLVFSTIKYDDVSVYTKSESCSVPAADQTAAEGAMPASSDDATGADMSVFDWTITKEKGLF